MKFKTPRLKRCRSLGISPSYIGLNKKSNRAPKRSGRKLSEYGIQLREKQRVKFIYDVSEKQFRTYFEKASRSKGITGEVLLQILESRFDNVLFRAGFAKSRAQARQLISHGMFEVNGVKTNIASYLLKAGDEIKVRDIKKKNPVLEENINGDLGIVVPEWITIDKKNYSLKINRLPERDEIDLPVQEHLIVELYSK